MRSNISRVGVHEHFSENACNFLEEVYAYIFKKLKPKSIDTKILRQFRRINIVDSSSWKIPEKLQKVFPGFNKAGCKIQMMLEYKTASMNLLDITAENYPDQQYSKVLDKHIESNDLTIFDLGYSISITLRKIEQKKGFFICRLNWGIMKLYLKEEEQFEEIDTIKVLKKLKGRESIIEIDCYVGSKENKQKVRLFAIEAPEEVANNRRRKLNKAAKKRGYKVAKRSSELCGWSFFITNIPEKKKVTAREIIALYKIRWDIEIFFKQLKSILNIHRTEVKSNENRFKCEVLGKSILAMFISYCYSTARFYSWEKYQEISFEKTVKYFKRNIGTLLLCLQGSGYKILKHIRQVLSDIIRTCKKVRQKSRKSSFEILRTQLIYEDLNLMKITQVKLAKRPA
ncbi:MAG: IS4 family transposase [Candidatus Omnitrophota bacterium]